MQMNSIFVLENLVCSSNVYVMYSSCDVVCCSVRAHVCGIKSRAQSCVLVMMILVSILSMGALELPTESSGASFSDGFHGL